MLSTPGIGSGLDISGIIDSLMAIENQPLVKLGTAQVELQAQLSGFGKLKSSVALFQSAMDELADASKFKYFKATSSDIKILTATASSTAAKGTYAVDVERIAENHRLAAATVFSDNSTTVIGAPGDTMTIGVGATQFVVDIGDKTLSGVRDAINAASNNAGVTASILHDDAGYHLTLSADETGATSFITVAYSAADPFALQSLNLDRDGSGGFTAADLNAVVTLENTFTITRSSNTIDDVIDGVTLKLVSAGAVSLDVARDNAKITGSVQQFISSYNDVAKLMDELRVGVLREERSSLLNLASQFRAILNTQADTAGAFSMLAELGVSTGLDGKLSLDTDMLEAALTSDPEGVADLFANDDYGLAVRFGDLADTLLAANGLFSNREQSLNSRIDATEDRRANLEFRLVQKEAALVAQYSALDALIAQLTSTSDFLSTQLQQITAPTIKSRNAV